MFRFLFLLLFASSILFAEKSNSTSQTITLGDYLIIIPTHTDSAIIKKSFSIIKGQKQLVSTYQCTTFKITLSSDSLVFNNKLFKLSSKIDTLVVNKDTLIILPKNTPLNNTATSTHRYEIISNLSYLDITTYANSNKISWAPEFKKLLQTAFGNQKWFYFYFGPIWEQIITGISGPPYPIKHLKKTIYQTASFRHHSPSEKVAITIDTEEKLIAITMCTHYDGKDTQNKYEYSPFGFITYYSSEKAHQILEFSVQGWIQSVQK